MSTINGQDGKIDDDYANDEFTLVTFDLKVERWLKI